MNLLLKEFANHITLDPEEQAYILTLFEIKNYKAKTFLLKEGETCLYFYFVTKGSLCGFFLDNNKIEKVIRLATPGRWVTDFKSFHNQVPSHFHLKTLTDSEIMLLSFENYEKLFRAIPKLERYFRLMICEVLADATDRLKDSLLLTAEERYDKFITSFPDLAYQISQKYIASYITVTPEFLSKIKSRQFKK
jgi:CRP-like cAMP-binding protein